MASTSELARRYFEALSAHDLEAATALWHPGGVDRIVGQEDVIAPDGIAKYFGDLFEAFPDFALEVVDTTTYRNRCAVRWRATGTFAGPGYFQGFAPNGARVRLEGCDVVTVTDELISGNEAYYDSADVARQLGLLPPTGSKAEAGIARAANVRTRLRRALVGWRAELIAPGVWIVRGGLPRLMNVYLIEDRGRVTMFDAGISAMVPSLLSAGALLGGIERVVLSHADADHRGAAPRLGVPVYCHPLEVQAAGSTAHRRDYWDLSKLPRPAELAYPQLLRSWDGGPTEVAGTVEEGDEVAGFRVVELPGHAPGLIGLFRERDRLALVSDCVLTINVAWGRKQQVGVPHPALSDDVDQARQSMLKLAALEPAIVWTGHLEPVAGEDVDRQLEQAAGA